MRWDGMMGWAGLEWGGRRNKAERESTEKEKKQARQKLNRQDRQEEEGQQKSTVGERMPSRERDSESGRGCGWIASRGG